MQAASFGALEQHIARLYLIQLVRAVQAMHHNGVLHGNLSGTKVHLDMEGNLAIRDYGSDS